MKVVISIHDVCDASIRETEFLIRALERYPKTFLVIPRWNNDGISRELVAMLHGHEVALHGLTHKGPARDFAGRLLLLSDQSLKEFARLDKAETSRRISEATDLFRDAFGSAPDGFVPPMWHHNKFTKEVLYDLRFLYTESAGDFVNLKNSIAVRSVPVCFDYGNNKALNQLALFSWRALRHLPQPVIRFSVHPSDIRNGYWPRIRSFIEWFRDHDAEFFSNRTFSDTICYPSLSAH